MVELNKKLTLKCTLLGYSESNNYNDISLTFWGGKKGGRRTWPDLAEGVPPHQLAACFRGVCAM